MGSDDLMLIFKAQSIIQREALVSALAEENVEATTAHRHMSNRVADGTIDLALEGYSAVFDGFPIFVKERDRVPAQRVIREFLERTGSTEVAERTDASPHLTKFFFCSIFTIILPGIFHVVGAYHLFKGVQAREKISLIRLVAALALFTMTLSLVWLIFKKSL